MWSIANLKENLHKIALDVHQDDDEDLSNYSSRDRDDQSLSDRRISHNFAHSNSPLRSPIANGYDSTFNSEIEQYRTEIRKLQESEAEIKALSINYAALLKEKEDQISRLNEENDSLKQSLDATKAAFCTSRSDILKTSTNGLNMPKGSGDQSPNHQHKAVGKNRTNTSSTNNGFVPKKDGLSNGMAYPMQQPDVIQTKMGGQNPNIQGNKQEFADLLAEKNKSLAALQASHELQMKQMGIELDKEHDKLARMELKLLEEQKLNGSFRDELNSLKLEKDKTSIEMNKIRDELNKKISQISQLKMEIRRRDNEEAEDTVENLKQIIATLEEENGSLKVGKDGLKANLKAINNSSLSPSASEASSNHATTFSEKVQSSTGFPRKEEMELSLLKLEKDLKVAHQEREKALQELNRLKQHLLEKESEESEKMDEDNKLIEELRETNEYQRSQISHLEKTLKQAITSQEEVKFNNTNELKKSKEIVRDLNKKLASCMATIEAKNDELLKLQTVLGQCYAEIESKEHLGEDLALAREESSRLSGLLKDAYQQAEILKKEKEEILMRLSEAERMLAEGRNRVNKLEEDNDKLRRALEQSMTRLNRMSMDSDYFVDRRIVIKLLVTYFQRNHSKEVLDLMVRMLGFSDEDKQRIGIAQQGAGKRVVRGVLGLPGRLVGGILGGSSDGGPKTMASENQSFADLWVDFLLKETEERERRGSAEAGNQSKGDQYKTSPNASAALSPLSADHGAGVGVAPDHPRASPFLNLNQSPLSRGNFGLNEQPNSEFSTVPLTSDNSQVS